MKLLRQHLILILLLLCLLYLCCICPTLFVFVCCAVSVIDNLVLTQHVNKQELLSKLLLLLSSSSYKWSTIFKHKESIFFGLWFSSITYFVYPAVFLSGPVYLDPHPSPGVCAYRLSLLNTCSTKRSFTKHKNFRP
jgi:hypothetical protein